MFCLIKQFKRFIANTIVNSYHNFMSRNNKLIREALFGSTELD